MKNIAKCQLINSPGVPTCAIISRVQTREKKGINAALKCNDTKYTKRNIKKNV